MAKGLNTRFIAVGIALLFGLLSVVGCAADSATDHPAVVVVRELLELRRDDVREASAYEQYFEDPALAEAVATGSDSPTGTPAVPEYDPPYLSDETSSTAEVAVVWKADEDFAEWPPVTVFVLSLANERWIVVDAREATSAPEPFESTAAR